MPDYSDDAILSAIERFKKGEETKSDRKVIAHALDSKHIEIAPAEDSKIIEQTGGTNFGQENEIRISGDVTQIVGGFTFEQALDIAKLQEKGGDNKSKIIVALIGAGGYGQPILTGIRLDDVGLILQGAIPAAILALTAQGGFDLMEKILVPKGLRLKSDSL